MSLEPAEVADWLRMQIPLASGEMLYGVVDGAQDWELAYEAQCLFGQEIRSLFQGDSAASVANVAPYLVPIDPKSNYLHHWAARVGKNAGILLTTAASVDQLHAHLRKLFIITDETGQEFFFRFYDPRVVRVFLPACTPAELAEFFGPIQWLFLEGPEPQAWLRFQKASDRLVQTSLNFPASIPSTVT